MFDYFYFTRPTPNEVNLNGIEIGPKYLQALFARKEYEIWRWPGHKVWVDRFSPWEYTQTVYMLVQVLTQPAPGVLGYAKVLKSCTPGRLWHYTVEIYRMKIAMLLTVPGRAEEGENE